MGLTSSPAMSTISSREAGSESRSASRDSAFARSEDLRPVRMIDGGEADGPAVGPIAVWSRPVSLLLAERWRRAGGAVARPTG